MLARYISTVAVVTSLLLSGCATKQAPGVVLKTKVSAQIDSLYADVHVRIADAIRERKSPDEIQGQFLAARLRYKHIEHFVEHFASSTARFINGPALDDIEVEEHLSTQPAGFQVLEELIFPYDTANAEQALQEIKLFEVQLKRLSTIWESYSPQPPQVLEAMRIQLFRIITLGISGFDSPIALNSIDEAKASLAGMRETLRLLTDDTGSSAHKELERALLEAESYLATQRDFDKLDRARFIVRYINPASRALADYRQKIGITSMDDRRMFRMDAVTLFDENAFDENFYSSTVDRTNTALITDLGETLFYDPVLSGNQTRSCASCHQRDKAFTDGLSKNASFSGRSLPRNTPSLLNAAFQNAQFHDMRSTTLEVQARDVVENKDEMHGSFSEAGKKLAKDDRYRKSFKDAFGTDSITSDKIQFALASYVRSLTSTNAPFDRYMRGDSTQLTPDQIDGFNLFMGKAKCGICHFMPLFNGTVPPTFAETESEVIGVPLKAEWTQASADPDLGRFLNTQMDQHKYAFKTPTVRNAAVTAPYMHNGVYKTLEEVIRFYNHGGGAGIGIQLENQTLPSDSLKLSDDEQRKLVRFIESLTDTSATAKRTTTRAALATTRP